MRDDDCTEALRARVLDAIGHRTPLTVAGSGSKAFLGHAVEGVPLDVGAHRGVVHYAPEELVLTVRAGTALAEVETLLGERGQMLAFEPPHYGDDATIGGTLAAGLSGPRRAAAGSARDFVLGARVLTGRGEVLRFGGEVIKNVAGYDLSRLMVGAHGTLGVLLDASFKVLPRPRCEWTLVQDAPDSAAAVGRLCAWAGKPLPISASAVWSGRLYLRLSGAEPAVAQAARQLGGERLDDGDVFWRDLREQRLAFFDDQRPLWRLSLAPATVPLHQPLASAGDCLLEWGGALRWLKTDAPAEHVFAVARKHGGHATLWRNAPAGAPRSQPLPAPLLALHQRVKAALDPHGLFNRGRLYPEF